MKPSIQLNKEEISNLRVRFNETREPDNEWQSLLKAVISQVMDDYIRLQHPSRRDQHYLKEAFCSAIACLWDEDYEIEWPQEDKEPVKLSFKEILASRFGIEELSQQEIHKINLGLIQEECIREAKAYWLDKQLEVVTIPDFLIFDGRAFSIWRTDEESKIDYENAIIYIEDTNDSRELNQSFIRLTMELAAYYRGLKIKDELLDEFSDAWYELLRMNSCFRC